MRHNHEMSLGVEFVESKSKYEAFCLREFIHSGGSCGLNSGCNNVSPHRPWEFIVDSQKLPATLTLELWQDYPNHSRETPDLLYQVEFY